MTKDVNSERLLTLEFLREEGRQRYSLRDSTSTTRDAIMARNLSTKFLSRWWNPISLDFSKAFVLVTITKSFKYLRLF